MVRSEIRVSLSGMVVLHNFKKFFMNDAHTGKDIFGCMYSYFYLLSQGLAKIVASMMPVKFNKRSLRGQVSGHVSSGLKPSNFHSLVCLTTDHHWSGQTSGI